MASYYTYSTPTSITTGFSGTAINSGATTVGSTINNTSDKATHMDVMVTLWYGGSNDTGNVQIGLRYSFDGTTWENTNNILIIDSLYVPAGSVSGNPYRYILKDIKILPYYLALAVKNLSDWTVYATLTGYSRKMAFLTS